MSVETAISAIPGFAEPVSLLTQLTEARAETVGL